MARIDNAKRARKPVAATLVPGDVRLMNLLALGLVLLSLGVMASGVWAVMKTSRTFALRTVEVASPLQRASLSSMRTVAAPRVAGNFFSIDMAQARAAFESVPWVRRANVRRVWPNGLEVTIEEHRATAFWDGGDDDDRLVNEYGEVFDADIAEVEDERLPMLGGPDGSSRGVLTLHQQLRPLFASLGARIEALRMSRRGSWQVELHDGAVLELGRGSDSGDTAEVLERTARFVRTFAEVAAKLGNPTLRHADLRHPNGYALQLDRMDVGDQPPTTNKKR